jgi:hypothetical protein
MCHGLPKLIRLLISAGNLKEAKKGVGATTKEYE